MEKQKTIEREITISGTGLHTGNKVKVVFKPAPVDAGISFVRTDLPEKPKIKADINSLLSQSRSPRRTSIGGQDFDIQTIEHLMSALAGSGIDNLIIEIDNKEVPGMDGSSLNFLEALAKAGIKEQEKERLSFTLKEPIFIEEEGSYIIAFPSSDFKISYTLDYRHPYLKTQFLELKIDPDAFKSLLAPARTFCLEEEAAQLRSQGLGCGANYDNTLVVGKNGVVKNTLRFDDEFIRHKILDLLGDLYLLGSPLKAHVIAIRSGHSLNLKLVKKISEQKARSVSAGVSAGYVPEEGEVLDVSKIKQILPHRQPFLFVDRIVSLEKGKRATGLKNVTINDYFFEGHFPGRPVMPGVLILEALAQVGGVMMLASEENRGKLAFFLSADNVKFRKTVLPGDQLMLQVEAGKVKSKTAQVFGKAFVDGKIVAEADFMCALVES
ncbi:MAG: bifunctional UDP-3-O-[3-hydroxymyristoyl] N-acetylglucosamine deacetylase/3-hydroxyacyl-ACP dehydratase [Candidatus Omnitrophica bacterium]|nr:bifunctional UDP-3-O-[3-hydroxymyristoyl] N-acetylglucosamine deacetylase/3-hydroxyacyl-ACP dehydratase [Candidatus Omnitrophota bacterium]